MSISVIIPTLNEAGQIGSLLDTLYQVEDLEIIVVDGGSSDDTLEIVKQYSLTKCLQSDRGRGLQMNQGAQHAKGEILFFLHADSTIHISSFSTIRTCLQDPEIGAGTLCLSFDSGNPILQLLSWFTRINHPLFIYGDQGLFIRKNLFQGIGGFANIPFMEDIDILAKIRKDSQLVKLKEEIITSARRFERKGVMKQILLNIFLLSAFHMGVSPHKLSGLYS